MPEAEGLGGGRVNSNKGTKMDDKTNAVVDALRNGVEMMGRATETINDLRAKLAASEAEAARLRKLFDDAGQGEHNVLALVDHYQEPSIVTPLPLVSEEECARRCREVAMGVMVQAHVTGSLEIDTDAIIDRVAKRAP